MASATEPPPKPAPAPAPAKPPEPNEPTGAKDGSSYYGYLFEPSKVPTMVLDALLRAIGQHIVSLTTTF